MSKKFANIKGDTIEIYLRHLNATKIQKINSNLFFVEFNIDNNLIEYSYNINTKDKFFLQRIKPYPIPEGVFSNEKDVYNFIKSDIARFKNATKSKNYEQFVDINLTLNRIILEVENLFLTHNVDKECLNILCEGISNVENYILNNEDSFDIIEE